MKVGVSSEFQTQKLSYLIKLVFIFMSFVILPQIGQAQPCPKVAGYADRNCDGEFRIVFLGDSLVFGIGDSANKNKGGYVLRVAKKLKTATISNFGVPGATSVQLLATLKAGFSETATAKQKALATALTKADVVVVDLGRNDYFLNDREQTAQQTLSTLQTINSFIKNKVKEREAVVPYIVQAVIMRPNRTDQGVFVKDLDQLILKSHSASFLADLRFDLVSKRLLAADQIHPTAKGYQAIATVFLKYLQTKIAAKL